MRGAIAIAGALGAFAAFAGCSIFSLDGFSGGDTGNDGGAADAIATADATDATGATNTTDVAIDASDAGTDAAFTCDGGNYLFCSTFDDGSLTAGWDLQFTKFGGTLSLSNDARSPAYAMRAQLPAMTAPDNQYARLYKAIAGVPPIRISFDVKMATPAWEATSKAVVLFEINYPTTSNSSYLFREVAQTTLSSEQNGTYSKIPDLPYDQWVRVSIDVVPTTPNGALRVHYDGQKVFENSSVPFETPTTPQTDVFIGLGRFDPPSPAIDVLYDNVSIEQIP